MTAGQKKRSALLEAQPGKADPQATRRSVEQLVCLVAPAGEDLVVHSDEHRACPRAFRRLPHRIEHHAVSSRRDRNRNNPLFAVDLFDRLVRHCGSNHERATIPFSRRRQGTIERAAVTQLWRNFQQRRSERRSDSIAPAQALRLTSRRVTTREILSRRLFPTLVPLPEPLRASCFRGIETRCIPRCTRHALRYAV